MTPQHPQRQRWTGSAAMKPGLGVFRGHSGDNREHRHGAHQLSIGLEGPVEIHSGSRCHRAPGLLIRANVPHRQAAGKVLSLYLDPTTTLAVALLAPLAPAQAVCALPPRLCNRLLQCFAGGGDLAAGLERMQNTFGATAPEHPRLRQALQALRSEASLQQLAAQAGLSPSRYSHWFREHTGMPLRSYRKWLRLLRGMELALAGAALTTAAHESQFADQAHFSRSFMQMFGVRPSAALAQLQRR